MMQDKDIFSSIEKLANINLLLHNSLLNLA